MLHQLTSSTFHVVQDLFDVELHLAVVAALASETPAELYVDDPGAPRAALLILRDRRFYLAGTPRDEVFGQALAGMLRGRYGSLAPGEQPFACTIAYTPDAWERRLSQLFASIRCWREERQYYRLSPSDRTPSGGIPDGFRVRPIDAALVSETGLSNHEALIAEIQSEAPSVAEFLARKFGFCVQAGQELAGWCLSEYNYGDRCELGIETLPAFRRRGLAKVTALATIAHAQSVGIRTIGWHCWKRNIPSSALALTLGFAHIADYPVWNCRFEPRPTL